MWRKRILRGGAIWLVIGSILAGCNFSVDDNPTPTPVPTRPVVVVPTIQPSPTQPPTFTPVPSATTTFTLVPTVTPLVTATPIPPTQTPYVPPTLTVLAPTATLFVSARVCETCDQLRLRDAPGTAGTILTNLPANTPLDILGRTEDNAWLEVGLADGGRGWVAAQYVTVNIDLAAIGVTGVAQNAPEPVVVPSGGSGVVSSNVISGVSSNARRIYLAGQARGNRADAFEKVGDSITYSWAYLYDLSGNYSLGEYGYLATALGFFSGPNGRGENCFAASPIAAYPGWTTYDVLKPGNAKTGNCAGSETPLVCAYRTGQPSVALIMLGTNDVAAGLDIGTFQHNLQMIVEISIDMGVIPVLSTIPPFPTLEDRANAFNEVIRATARANDVPLWDYWSSMNNLPNRGLSWDGVHPSESPDRRDADFDTEHLQYGFNVRNLQALQVLDQLWRYVLYDAEGGSSVAVAPPAAPTDPPPVEDVGAVDPATYSCPGTLPIRLTVGGTGRVTPGAPNKIRSGPSISNPHIATMPGEAAFSVTGGPVCADGYTWWKVNYNGTDGWTASGSASEYWVEPG